MTTKKTSVRNDVCGCTRPSFAFWLCMLAWKALIFLFDTHSRTSEEMRWDGFPSLCSVHWCCRLLELIICTYVLSLSLSHETLIFYFNHSTMQLRAGCLQNICIQVNKSGLHWTSILRKVLEFLKRASCLITVEPLNSTRLCLEIFDCRMDCNPCLHDNNWCLCHRIHWNPSYRAEIMPGLQWTLFNEDHGNVSLHSVWHFKFIFQPVMVAQTKVKIIPRRLPYSIHSFIH